MKTNYPVSLGISGVPNDAYLGLNENQRIMFDLFIGHYLQVLSGEEPDPILLHVDGQGGTGKSHVIRTVSAWLDRLAAIHELESPVVRAAPTGVAANNINGFTLHSLLRLLISKAGTIDPLSDIEAQCLQRNLRHYRYFVIDEKSMVSNKTLFAIDQRLRQAFLRHKDELFGGRSIMLLGDFY